MLSCACSLHFKQALLPFSSSAVLALISLSSTYPLILSSAATLLPSPSFRISYEVTPREIVVPLPFS